MIVTFETARAIRRLDPFTTILHGLGMVPSISPVRKMST